jgi:hypothetical protein
LILSSRLVDAGAVGVASFSSWCVHLHCHCGAAALHACQRCRGNKQPVSAPDGDDAGACKTALLSRLLFCVPCGVLGVVGVAAVVDAAVFALSLGESPIFMISWLWSSCLHALLQCISLRARPRAAWRAITGPCRWAPSASCTS